MTVANKRRQRSLDATDMMPGELRACVHDYGLPIVETLTKHGVKNPRHIREIVSECWSGARQQGQKCDAFQSVDALLSRGLVSFGALQAFLAENNLVIVGTGPTPEMIKASMSTVSDFSTRCTKEEKHRLRIQSALAAELKSQKMQRERSAAS